MPSIHLFYWKLLFCFDRIKCYTRKKIAGKSKGPQKKKHKKISSEKSLWKELGALFVWSTGLQRKIEPYEIIDVILKT